MGFVKNAFAVAAAGLALSAVLTYRENPPKQKPKYIYQSTTCNGLYNVVLMPQNDPYLLYLDGAFTRREIVESAEFLKIKPEQMKFYNCNLEI